MTLEGIPNLDTLVDGQGFQLRNFGESTLEPRDEPVAVLVAREHVHEEVDMPPWAVHPQGLDPHLAQYGLQPGGVVEIGMGENEMVDEVPGAVVGVVECWRAEATDRR